MILTELDVIRKLVRTFYELGYIGNEAEVNNIDIDSAVTAAWTTYKNRTTDFGKLDLTNPIWKHVRIMLKVKPIIKPDNVNCGGNR